MTKTLIKLGFSPNLWFYSLSTAILLPFQFWRIPCLFFQKSPKFGSKRGRFKKPNYLIRIYQQVICLSNFEKKNQISPPKTVNFWQKWRFSEYHFNWTLFYWNCNDKFSIIWHNAFKIKSYNSAKLCNWQCYVEKERKSRWFFFDGEHRADKYV